MRPTGLSCLAMHSPDRDFKSLCLALTAPFPYILILLFGCGARPWIFTDLASSVMFARRSLKWRRRTPHWRLSCRRMRGWKKLPTDLDLPKALCGLMLGTRPWLLIWTRVFFFSATRITM